MGSGGYREIKGPPGADRRPSPSHLRGAAAAGEYAPLNCEFRPPILHKRVARVSQAPESPPFHLSRFHWGRQIDDLATLVDPPPPIPEPTPRYAEPTHRHPDTRYSISACHFLIENEFVLRYETERAGAGLPADEGAFLACSFWLVDSYILQGRYSEARELFKRLLSRCNDVRLLAEELDPLTGRMLGSFPQAYSHVGVINCALNLSRQNGPTEVRAESQRSPITATAE